MDENATVFVKQQGAMRTGTNLVKFGLEENFTNVRVLVNIGRWKHASSNVNFDWTGKNWEGIGASVNPLSRISHADLARAQAAFESGTLKYALSIRSIYSWLPSYLRFVHMADDVPPSLADLPPCEVVRAVSEWNKLYSSYLEMLSSGAVALVFRLEDLTSHWAHTLDRARDMWSLRKRHDWYARPEYYLESGVDGMARSQLLDKSRPFVYVPDCVEAARHRPTLDLVRRTVDRDLLRAFNYELM